MIPNNSKRGRPCRFDRRQVLYAGVQLASDVNLWNVTATRLAVRTGIARTTITYHFRTNDDLRNAISRCIS